MDLDRNGWKQSRYPGGPAALADEPMDVPQLVHQRREHLGNHQNRASGSTHAFRRGGAGQRPAGPIDETMCLITGDHRSAVAGSAGEDSVPNCAAGCALT